MKLKVIFKTLLFLAAVVLAGEAVQDGFAATLTIAPSGDGVYALQGVGMDGVAAMEIKVSYDPASLMNPRIAQGGLVSGAVVAINDRIPGQVRMAIIRTTPVKGNGVIATFTFDRAGSAAGKILSLTAKFSNIEGKAIPVLVQISNAAESAVSASDQGAAATVGSGAASAAAGIPVVTPGGAPMLVVAPAPGQQKEQAVSSPMATEPAAEKTSATRATAVSPEAAGMTASLEQAKGIQQFTSVLDRFREYRGERTVKALLALFEQRDAASGFRQEPRAVLTDGKATAKIIFSAKAPGGLAPDFALNNARLISMKRDYDQPDTWVAEVKPGKGAHAASLIVSWNGAMREFPLTLAPKVTSDPKTPGKFTEKAFSLYLSGKGRDLNNDGTCDYIDDYMYAVNYVAVQPVK